MTKIIYHDVPKSFSAMLRRMSELREDFLNKGFTSEEVSLKLAGTWGVSVKFYFDGVLLEAYLVSPTEELLRIPV